MEQVVKLTGARVALSGDRSERIDLSIRRGRFLPFDTKEKPDSEYDMTGRLLLPGLINAHDHLEFNLFPRLGRGPWPNASEWASHIYHPESSPIREHLLVPKRVRLIWGGIRNLISGVTTVAHHNPLVPALFSRSFPVRVPRKFGWAHSLDFSPDASERFNGTPSQWPFIIHAAEGSDDRARSEIPRLEKMGLLNRRTVLVHATGADSSEIARIRNRGAAIVWCPTSNLFTVGRTLCRAALRSGIVVTLGTDSALTAEGDLIDEIRVAAREGTLTPEEVWPLVTTNAARALRLKDGQGGLREGGVADLVAVADTGQTPVQALADLRPDLVMVGGRVMLKAVCSAGFTPDFHPLEIEGRGRFFVRAPIPRIYAAAVRALGSEIRLAGKRVTA